MSLVPTSFPLVVSWDAVVIFVEASPTICSASAKSPFWLLLTVVVTPCFAGLLCVLNECVYLSMPKRRSQVWRPGNGSRSPLPEPAVVVVRLRTSSLFWWLADLLFDRSVTVMSKVTLSAALMVLEDGIRHSAVVWVIVNLDRSSVFAAVLPIARLHFAENLLMSMPAPP